MWPLLVICALLALVSFLGVLPVISEIRKEKRPSPWAFQEENSEETTYAAATHEDVNIPNNVSAEYTFVNKNKKQFITIENSNNTSTSFPDVNVNLETIVGEPVFEISSYEEGFENENVGFYEEPIEPLNRESILNMNSEPTVEAWSNIKKLLGTTLVKEDTIAEEKLEWIESNFGEKVAKLVTGLPNVKTGSHVIIGKFHSDTNAIAFETESLLVESNIPKELDGEYVLVKGEFLKDHTFFVQHWEDPDMVNEGYSDYFNKLYQDKLLEAIS